MLYLLSLRPKPALGSVAIDCLESDASVDVPYSIGVPLIPLP